MREQLFQEAEDRVREDTRTAIAMQEKKLRAEAAEAAHRKAELSEKKVFGGGNDMVYNRS